MNSFCIQSIVIYILKQVEIEKELKANNVSFVYLQFTDLLGSIKNVVIGVNRFLDAIDTGIWFDGSSVEGFARIAESDMHLRPDISTFTVLPWSPPERKAVRVICDIYSASGKRLEADPRGILQRVLKQANALGFDYQTAAEFEFYLFEREHMPKLAPHDQKSYFDYTPHSRAAEICELTMKSLPVFGIEGETHHHEVGKGQHEIDIKYDSAIKSADNILTLKTALKAYTSGTELKASWMPKPIFGTAGNGMHIHQSFWTDRNNTFFEARNRYSLSKIAQSFLAGQLSHAKALSAIVSPSVNSYKRLVPGYEAPVYICWGQQNRSALIRIPQNTKEKAPTATRIEYRAPDATSNPYLAFAALLSAGLDGMKRRLSPPSAVEENVYHLDRSELNKNHIDTLPTNLKEAIEALKNDKVILAALGKAADRYIEIKEAEWSDYSRQVTDWEKKRYL